LTLLVAVGCGADPAERASATSDAASLLQQTSANTAKLKSASLALRVAGGDTHAVLSGPIVVEQAGKLPKFALSAKVTSGSQTKTLGATWTGDQGFVALEGKTYAVPAAIVQMATAGYEQALQQGPQLGLDASKWIVSPRNAGLATVGGVQTIKITGKADLAQIKASVQKLGQGPLGTSVPDISGGAAPVKDATVTVYTGAQDQILRRLVVNADVKGAPAMLDLTLSDVNAPQKITAPAHARPFSELMTQLQRSGLAPGAMGGGIPPAGPAAGGLSGGGTKHPLAVTPGTN
jgi:hypothetical protein